MITKVTEQQFDEMAEDLQLDLLAVFNLAQESCLEMLHRGSLEGWGPEQIQEAIDGLFAPEPEVTEED